MTPVLSNTIREIVGHLIYQNIGYLHKFYFPEDSQASPGSQVYIIYTWDLIKYISVDILI